MLPIKNPTTTSGQSTTFKVQVRPAENYPVDLYYLMDLSLSMNDDKAKLSDLGLKYCKTSNKPPSNKSSTFHPKNNNPLE